MSAMYQNLYARIKQIKEDFLSPSNRQTKAKEESWNGVKLFAPQIKPENGWTEYKMLFPVNFYEDKINQQIIGAKPKDWFLRPHHIETITEHVKSVKDNMLNPKYFSRLNFEGHLESEESFEQWKRRKGCGFEMSDTENQLRKNIFKSDQLISDIQRAQKLLQTRARHFNDHFDQSRANTASPFDALDPEIKNTIYQKVFDAEPHTDEKETENKEKNENKNISNLEIKVYENFLDVLRSNELAILNTKRAKEVNQVQVEDPHWYELKDTKFYGELKRIRLRNIASRDSEIRINKLMDDSLY